MGLEDDTIGVLRRAQDDTMGLEDDKVGLTSRNRVQSAASFRP
jgi:hypothetical protein